MKSDCAAHSVPVRSKCFVLCLEKECCSRWFGVGLAGTYFVGRFDEDRLVSSQRHRSCRHQRRDSGASALRC